MKTSMKTMLAALAMLLSAGLMAAEGWGTNFKKAKGGACKKAAGPDGFLRFRLVPALHQP